MSSTYNVHSTNTPTIDAKITVQWMPQAFLRQLPGGNPLYFYSFPFTCFSVLYTHQLPTAQTGWRPDNPEIASTRDTREAATRGETWGQAGGHRSPGEERRPRELAELQPGVNFSIRTRVGGSRGPPRPTSNLSNRTGTKAGERLALIHS